jgi:hypothetical protein
MRIVLKITALLALGLATVALAACGGDDDGGGGGEPIAVSLVPSGDASQFGTGTLSPEGEQTRVTLRIDSPVSNSQPAGIYEGTCASLASEPAYTLPNVEGGTSEGTVDVALDTLTAGSYSIALRMSDDDPTGTSCGEIVAAE